MQEEDKNNITISIVTYNSEGEIGILMRSLQESSSFNDITVYVVDNMSSDNTVELVRKKYHWAKIIENKKNVGFGKGHNIVIKKLRSKYHIIANPDTSVEKDSIKKAIRYMDENSDVVIMTPCVLNTDGTQQFLPKKNPSIKYLFGGFFEKYFKFCKKLREEYTLENKIITAPVDVEFCTGAFMFVRTDALQQIGGFDERYFLHFEDADLTRELRKIGRAVYHPDIKITHKWNRENRKIGKSFFIAVKSMLIYMKKWKNERVRKSNYSFNNDYKAAQNH